MISIKPYLAAQKRGVCPKLLLLFILKFNNSIKYLHIDNFPKDAASNRIF